MDPELFRWIVSLLLALIVSVVGFMGKRLFERTDELANGKANRDSTDKRFEDVLQRYDAHVREDREIHMEIGRKLDRTNEHLSVTNTTLAALAGRFEATRDRPEG